MLLPLLFNDAVKLTPPFGEGGGGLCFSDPDVCVSFAFPVNPTSFMISTLLGVLVPVALAGGDGRGGDGRGGGGEGGVCLSTAAIGPWLTLPLPPVPLLLVMLLDVPSLGGLAI